MVLVHWGFRTCYIGEVLDRAEAPSRSGAATWVLEDLTQLVGVVCSQHLEHGAGVLALLFVQDPPSFPFSLSQLRRLRYFDLNRTTLDELLL